MPLDLILGPANASKAGVVLSRFRAEAESGSAPVLVVPTGADRETYENELLEDGALIGGRVVTWERFVRDLARRGGVKGRLIGPLRRRLIVREVVEAGLANKSLRGITDSARAPGFPVALERLVVEHSRGLVLDDLLEEMLSESSPSRAAATMSLVRAYFERLADGEIIDRDLQARRSLDALRTLPAIGGSESVLFYGFSDLTAVQVETIKALAHETDVMVSLPTETERRVGVAQTAALRLKAGSGNGLEVRETLLEADPESNGVLGQLADKLFSNSAGSVVTDDGSSVRILTGSGARATAELAAGAVLELIQDGMAPEAIAVVRPHADGDALLESILNLSGVDVARPESAPLGATTLGRGLIGLCRASFQADLATLEDGLAWVRVVAGAERALIVDRIEAELRRKGVHSAEEVLRSWDAQVGGQLETGRRLARHASKKDLADALATAADELLRAGPVSRGERLKRDTLFDAAVVSTVAKSALDLAELFDRDHPQTMIEELGALEVDIDTGSARTGAVLFTDPSSIRGRKVDAVVVYGLEHGLFPAASSHDPFLGDTPADCLGEARLPADEQNDIRYSSAAGRQEAGEKERFIACFARARKCVILVRRVRDDAGAQVASSAYQDEVLRLLGYDLEAFAERKPDRSAGTVEPIGDAEGGRLKLRLLANEAGGSRVRDLPATLGEAARAQIGSEYEKVVSPSRLEAYCDCPLKWLGQNVLGPKEMEPEGEPTFRGTAVHFALQRAVEVAIKEGDGRIEPAVMEAAKKAITEAIAKIGKEAANTLAARVALQRAETLSLQWLDLECSREWPAKAIEAEFEFGCEADPETGREARDPLDLGDGIKLRGTVDRIDVVEAGGERSLLVRDYKSGKTIWAQEKWESERRLQAPIYLLAAIQLLGGKPAAALYESVKDRKMRGAIVEGVPGASALNDRGKDAVSEDELQALIDSARKRARDAVMGIRDGLLHSDPAHCSYDGGCSYEWLCRTMR